MRLSERSHHSKLLSFIGLGLVAATLAFRPMIALAASEEVTTLDMFNAIPKTNPLESEWERFFSRSQSGGNLVVGVDYAIESLHAYSFMDGKPTPKRAPFLDGFVFETLMIEDARTVDAILLKPHISEKTELDPIALSIKVTIHPDAKFSDGEPIHARHIMASWPINRNALWTSIFEDVYGKEVVIEALSDRQVLIRFPKLAPRLFRRAAFYLLSDLRIVKPAPTGDTLVSQDLTKKWIGSGPYRIQQASRRQVVLARDANYWANGAPSLKGQYNFASITVKSYMDPTVVRLGLTRRETNFFRELNPSYLQWMNEKANSKKLKKVAQNVNYLVPDGSARALFMNMDRPHLRNLNFRKALALTWNAQTAAEIFGDLRETPSSPGALSALRPRGTPTEGVRRILESYQDPLLEEALKPYEEMGFEGLNKIQGERERLKAAMKLLNDIGYKVMQLNGELRLVTDGQPVKLKLISVHDRPDNRRAQLFIETLKKIGIEGEIRFFPDTSAAFRALGTGDYDFFPAGLSIHKDFHVLNLSYLRQSLHSSAIGGGPNRSHLRSPAIDGLLEQLSETEPSRENYPPLIDALMRTLSSYVPFILLGEPATTHLFTDSKLCVFQEVRAEELHKNALTIRTGYFGQQGCP